MKINSFIVLTIKDRTATWNRPEPASQAVITYRKTVKELIHGMDVFQEKGVKNFSDELIEKIYKKNHGDADSVIRMRFSVNCSGPWGKREIYLVHSSLV
jgi:hypothetical protein